MDKSLHPIVCVHHHLNGLVQDCSNSSANALELLQSCTKPLTYTWPKLINSLVDLKGTFQWKSWLTSKGIAIVKIKSSHDHLTFIMGVPIPGKKIFILKWAPGPHKPTGSWTRKCVVFVDLPIMDLCMIYVWPRFTVEYHGEKSGMFMGF